MTTDTDTKQDTIQRPAPGDWERAWRRLQYENHRALKPWKDICPTNAWIIFGAYPEGTRP